MAKEILRIKPIKPKEKVMGNRNSSTISFLKKNAEFADIANLALFQGNPVIKAEHLSELDTSEFIHIMKTNSTIKKEKPIQRYRDVLKSVKLNEQETYNIRLIVGNEAQSEVHYAMPVRNMLYDALNYTEQVNELAASNHENKNYSNSKEFLSGFTNNDRLIPVITIVIFFKSGQCNLKINKNDLQKEVVNMCQAVIDIKTEGIEEGLKQGIEQIIRNALLNKHTPEQIVEFMGVSLEDVLSVQEKIALKD